jgi:hypothetical protein
MKQKNKARLACLASHGCFAAKQALLFLLRKAEGVLRSHLCLLCFYIGLRPCLPAQQPCFARRSFCFFATLASPEAKLSKQAEGDKTSKAGMQRIASHRLRLAA